MQLTKDTLANVRRLKASPKQRSETVICEFAGVKTVNSIFENAAACLHRNTGRIRISKYFSEATVEAMFVIMNEVKKSF